MDVTPHRRHRHGRYLPTRFSTLVASCSILLGLLAACGDAPPRTERGNERSAVAPMTVLAPIPCEPSSGGTVNQFDAFKRETVTPISARDLQQKLTGTTCSIAELGAQPDETVFVYGTGFDGKSVVVTGQEGETVELTVMELTRFVGHLILGLVVLEEGGPDGSSIDVSRGVPARGRRAVPQL
jgi:hypothetical protein